MGQFALANYRAKASLIMTKRGPRPWEAEVLQGYIQYRVLQERILQIGPATPAQAKGVAMRLSEHYSNRLDRIMCMNWLIRREIDSSKALNRSEASVLIAWLDSDEQAVIAQECERVLRAALLAQGQQYLPFDDLPALDFKKEE